MSGHPPPLIRRPWSWLLARLGAGVRSHGMRGTKLREDNGRVGDAVEHTDDGRYVIIRGRRWRATDPAIPADVSAALRKELMSARRAVGTALRADDSEAERAARDRVHRTKLALGERGVPWWEQTDDERRARWEAGLPTDPA